MKRSLSSKTAIAAAVILIASSCGSDGDTGSGVGAGAGGSGSGGAAGATANGGSGGSTSKGGSGGSQGGSTGVDSGGTVNGGSAGDGDAGQGGSVAGAGGGAGQGAGGDPGHAGAGGDSGEAGAGGDSGQGGAAGAAGAGCMDVVDPAEPNCDDGDPDSIDFYSAAFDTCGRWFAAGGGSSGWVIYGPPGAPNSATVSVDVQTGLGWALISGSRNQANAAEACDGLLRLGLDGWRLSTIDEARTLAGGCATTVPGGSCPVSAPGCLDASCGQGAACESCPGGNQSISLREDELYCRPEVGLCTIFQTSSSCSDCGTPSAWAYGPPNGNLLTIGVGDAIPPVCVLPAVPNGVPCFDPDP